MLTKFGNGERILGRHARFPLTVMQFLKWLPSLLFATAVVAKEPPTELQIETTYMPDDCTVKAAKGDSIQVHYVRRPNDLLVPFKY